MSDSDHLAPVEVLGFTVSDAETANAILFFQGGKKVWIPKSQIQKIELELTDGEESAVLVIPKWLASKEGLSWNYVTSDDEYLDDGR